MCEIVYSAREYLNPQDINVVLYHKNCQDGETAACCAWRILGDKNVEYFAMHYGDSVDKKYLVGKNILLVDFSWDLETLEDVRTVANKVMILDHHKSAMNKLKNIEGCFFDLNESGASLAWYYFNQDSQQLPLFVMCVKDRDIWEWKYREFSEPMYYGLKDTYYDSFRFFDRFIDQVDLTQELIEYGEEIMKKQKEWIKKASYYSKIGKMKVGENYYKIVYVELYRPKLISELSEFLYTNLDIDFTLIWFKDKGNTIPKYIKNYCNNRFIKWYYGPQHYIMSFRTNKEHIDVSKIAEFFGGGGHAKAAGSKINFYPRTIIDESENVY